MESARFGAHQAHNARLLSAAAECHLPPAHQRPWSPGVRALVQDQCPTARPAAT